MYKRQVTNAATTIADVRRSSEPRHTTTQPHDTTEHPTVHDDTATAHGVTAHPTDQHNTATDHGHHNGGNHSANDTGDHGDGHEDDEHKCPPEGEDGLRYVVARFDFNHVRYPLIVAIWIIFVTYAKIGWYRTSTLC